MNQANLKQKADELFYWFENNRFQNRMNYSRQVNLVLEFCEYMETLEEDDLYQLLNTTDPQDVTAFRRLISEGLDSWLDSRIKTIFYS